MISIYTKILSASKLRHDVRDYVRLKEEAHRLIEKIKQEDTDRYVYVYLDEADEGNYLPGYSYKTISEEEYLKLSSAGTNYNPCKRYPQNYIYKEDFVLVTNWLYS